MRARVLVLVGLSSLGCNGGGDGGRGASTAPGTTSDDATTTTADDGNASTASSGGGATTLAASSESTTGEMNCGEQSFMISAVPPNVALVLDKSGSMLTKWDADADPNTPDVTRWNSLVNVVDFLVHTFDDEVNFGANLFPSNDATTQLGAGACLVEAAVEVPVAPDNAAAVLAGIPPAATTEIQGATPTTAGLQAAITHLQTLDPEVGRFLILVTDGAACCGADADTSMCPGVGCGLIEEYDDEVAQVVASAFAELEIPTFVVGIDIIDELLGVGNDGVPEANTFAELNEVAIAGGKPRAGDEKFFNARNEGELQDALSAIAGQVVSCTVPLGAPPVDPDFVEIEIGGNTIARVDDCANDGWMFADANGPFDAIVLCGAACDALAQLGELNAIYGCPPAG